MADDTTDWLTRLGADDFSFFAALTDAAGCFFQLQTEGFKESHGDNVADFCFIETLDLRAGDEADFLAFRTFQGDGAVFLVDLGDDALNFDAFSHGYLAGGFFRHDDGFGGLLR